MSQPIPIDRVRVGTRLRAVREDQVAALAASIAEVGLMQPISVYLGRERPEVGEVHEVYRIVTGAHRYLACRRLGWTEIAAEVIGAHELIRRLMEIDENLIRAELSELERSEHLRERKIVYEALHPETRRGVAQARGANATMGRGEDVTGKNPVTSFVADVAAKIGADESGIRRAVRRAEKIAPEVRAAIREEGIAHRGVDLDALTRLTPEDQAAAVERVRAGTAKDLRAAAQAINRGAADREGAKPDAVAQGPQAVRAAAKSARAVKTPAPARPELENARIRAAARREAGHRHIDGMVARFDDCPWDVATNKERRLLADHALAVARANLVIAGASDIDDGRLDIDAACADFDERVEALTNAVVALVDDWDGLGKDNAPSEDVSAPRIPLRKAGS